jgi:hypothetical protein
MYQNTSNFLNIHSTNKRAWKKLKSAWERLFSEKKCLSSSFFVFCGWLVSLAKMFLKAEAAF